MNNNQQAKWLYFSKTIMLGLGFGTLCQPLMATSINQTKHNLFQISQRISSIKHNIEENEQQHQHIKQKINIVQSQLDKNLLEQTKIKNQMTHAKTVIDKIQKNIYVNQRQIADNRQAIFQHLKLAMQLNQEPYWQILFSAKNPFEFYQQMELYQYLYDSEQKHFTKLKDNEIALTLQQKKLQKSQIKLTQLQQMLALNEKQILLEKATHQQKLKFISQKINEKTTELHQAEKAQDDLKKLMQSLLKNNTLQSHRSFSVMRRKLNFPLTNHHYKSQKVQNGIIFVAENGMAVHAVSAGKVVFADWLNGYGYLTIIDHGWGFMTLYGNNQNLVKHKGDIVKEGDVIAKVGSSGSFHQTGLYFEIRQRAHVISASSWFKQQII